MHESAWEPEGYDPTVHGTLISRLNYDTALPHLQAAVSSSGPRLGLKHDQVTCHLVTWSC